jgi:methylated-DNA-protein-cysteine methyltransferase-like protein
MPRQPGHASQRPFFNRVWAAVRLIPPSRVATYGQVAAYLGSSRSAQAVGWALAVCDPATVPWQRVVGRGGYLTIVNDHLSADLQRSLLEREGHKVIKRDGLWVVGDLEQTLWHPPATS